MTMPLLGSRRSGLRFRLFGFPISVDVSFLVVLAFLGYPFLSSGPAYLAVWIVVAAVSVLVHELGHAVTARAAGSHPRIDLYGFGGATMYETPPGGMSRARSIAISLAGPATGIVLGVLLLYAGRVTTPERGSLAAAALSAGVFVTLVWGLLNLLPILPLDGGNVLMELLPGSPGRRQRLAAIVSIVFAVLAGVVALLLGQLYAALLAGWFAVGNIATASARPTAAEPALTQEQAQRRDDDSRAVRWLVEQGRLAEAHHLAETAPVGVDPETAGVLLAALRDVEQGAGDGTG